ncbi:hypothetical protein ACRE_030530 [Hapsidospora chrysogenum ATCC 11550]|uniref:FAS1 domain-containing protein n=1 Tax=Hapsidospora chrysogenum (strain ATCC 11550 / CBS 779.69 / DSM 880 / IAM 14645 / JCM 23072 / IMI 49137) TaxID=857340 RepID=A0A086T9U1_HAPC1|nr:hypothetical protein ACRE_030530 [Hapsidospora chrysogenum ATCC 11550]
MKTQSLLSLALSALALAQQDDNKPSLTDALSSKSDTLSLLGELISNNTEVLEALQGATDITILAPDNDAISELLKSSAVTESKDSGLVPALLSYHVLNGTYMAADVKETPAFIPTLLGNAKYENVTGGQVVEAVTDGETVSFYSALKMAANVTEADIEFEGGVIHIINSVLQIPQSATKTAVEGGLSALVGAVTEADLGSTLDGLEDITIFAPNNDAFAAIASVVGELSAEDLAGILQYHVIQGTVAYSSGLEGGKVETVSGEEVNISIDDGNVSVNGAKVVIPDILIANGVVHVIDGVLNPDNSSDEPNPSTTTPAFTGASTMSDGMVPFTSAAPSPTESSATELKTGTSQQAAPRATAAAAMGVLLGGAASVVNGF